MIQQICDYFETKQHSLPKVKHFVFGSDEQALREEVAKFSDYYMFVDYGAFGSNEDSNNRLNDTFECAMTIAMPIGIRVVNYKQILDYQIECFDMVSQIRKDMLFEKKINPLNLCLSSGHQILPFVAPDICRSIGFTFVFRFDGKDILNAKDK